MSKPAVGFIGTGVMGKSMAGHIQNEGYPLYVYNRTKAKTDELCRQGAIWCDGPAEVAKHADIIITIVGYPKDVEEMYLHKNGLIEHASSGAVLIDMTTSRPDLAERIEKRAKEKGIRTLDAPVSGGDVGAREAKLAIMCGGDQEVFDQVMPVLSCMGAKIERLGPAGAGQHTKMANQIAIASTMLGVAESLAYAKAAGLSQEQVLNVIETGAAGSFSMSKLGRKMIAGDDDPGFYLKHFVKDMGIAIESAEQLGLNLPGLAQAKALYEKLEQDGFGDLGTQAIRRIYE
ncbi:NAD(P)-dependent oxidoreductase [Salisediminibacterium selenitireducens]|uniref:6-phosphogluconate dehydrogenase NAD-binding protein n=1 Tax=Bacillus selenitireducens (strain ATCC 700615 / DSM 15326 / MLS10) TaxID=439292 RepID=D6Y1D1_BACIE|nr:NAD(P)-dependent oxidoreductase [Salisediminibacterium selenitireducens]ADI00718.1 6-phosphogluconate dehydrogenase NAD-binding protein [[Bacillus] selenitireducens MLS10]